MTSTYYNPEHILRNTEKCRIYYMLDNNIDYNFVETVTDCFYIRDPRNGRGERDLGRICFNWLADKYPAVFVKICKYIPVYGRWDDLLYITNTEIRPFIYEFLALQINQDYYNMMIGDPITTCAKWMPTEGKSFARHNKNKFLQLLCHMKLKPKEYRIKISALRKYLETHSIYNNIKYNNIKYNNKTRRKVKRPEVYSMILNDLKIEL